jgi:signal peptidase I
MGGTKDQVIHANFLLRYSLQAFGFILLLAIFVRIFVFSSFVMSGAAMLPSIWPGDFLLAAKWGLRSPKHGEIVALRCPPSPDKLCLKRVIGLPGDRIEIRQGHLVINGQESQERRRGPLVTEVTPAGSWAVWPDTESQNLPPVVVPPHMVFLLNDKRSDLDDSRSWGPVSMELIEARAVRIWMSLDWFDGEQVRSWPRIRWMRLLRSID